MECSKLLAEGGYGILILKVEQGLLKKLASSERQGLNGKLLAEEGIGHTNCELHKGLFDMGTDIKLWKSSKKSQKSARKGDERCPGGHLYFRLDIILVKRLSKHTLNTYFSGMKIDPKKILHAFFLICVSCPFQNLSIWPKTYPFFPNFARFCTPKWYTRVLCLHGPEKQP